MIKVIDLMSQIINILYTVGLGDIIFFFNFGEIQLKFKIRLQKVLKTAIALEYSILNEAIYDYS